MSGVPERAEIDEQYTWDLEAIYETEEEWEEDFEFVQDHLPDLADYEGRLTSDGETLLSALELRDSVMRTLDTVSAYARMRSDEDTRDQHYQALSARAQTLASEASSAASFFGPEIQAEDEETIEAMIESTPGLETYEHYLEDVLRRKSHTRSAEVEQVLSEMGEVLGAPSDIYSMLTNADLTFPTVEKPDGTEVELSQSNVTVLLKESDRTFRRTVHETFFEELSTVRNTIGSALKYQVKTDVNLARTRNYDTAREAALDGPNIPVEVYDALVETVEDNIGKLHRHADLKRRGLGVDDLQMWDLYAPVAPGESPEFEYEEAREHVVEAVAPLGEEYQHRVSEGLDSRWADVYENRGKRSGAYSGGTYDTQPYILLNYQDDISSMFTLAHELGHSLHSELASEHQPYVDADYEIFVAEVASTVNEALLTAHLLDTIEDPHVREHVLNEYLERFRSTLFRQTMFADFEHRLHALAEDGEALTPDRIDEVYGDRKATYYEPAVVDDHIRREWMRVPHFFYGYYVFQYSTGMSAAIAIADRILSEGESAAADYLDALKLGGSEYPLSVLETAGIDMTSPDPIQTALDVYDERLDEMDDLLAADETTED
ncbi:oligoendopeptidase F [Halanaeroarchaeum sulfurireducens]|uniref:Oligoendopeptidase F n=1 Tax=Halanaeroarchaeum sulfurireducens TaxID=1604004 RepID=A0A0F7P916_9EURY|nr:oligoendopeptidase F [Halanaeroarchaeum sulfurireducens]AKH96680.1 oligoendopeptidase F [Halanaeroarchaeum sulfurireducens]